MPEYLYKGMKIYHKTNKTSSVILDLNDKNITIQLSNPIADKHQLTLPIKHIGEWLFYKIEDMDLQAYELVNIPEYIGYGNPCLIEEARRIEPCKELLEHLQSSHGFDGFYHCTDFVNFISIMQGGRNLCRNRVKQYDFKDAANQGVIAQTSEYVFNHVRFYYKEKSPTNYQNEGIRVSNSESDMPLPVFLVYKEDIIYHEGITFTDGNAAISKRSLFTHSATNARNFQWDEIFRRDKYGVSGQDPDVKNKMSEITRLRNAEFLYPEQIDNKYIKKVIFRCPADLKHARCIIGDNDLFTIDESKFFGSESDKEYINYLYDYEIISEGDGLKLNLNFKRNPKDYTRKLIVYYGDNIKEMLDITPRINYSINIPKKSTTVTKIEYLINGHRCAIWEEVENDRVLLWDCV